MTIQQLKSAIKKFRAADVSVIKDDALRAKAQKLQAKQKGFTLLELLVVITLLATLATAALVAYDGLGENASDASAANALLATESAIRNYRAVENAYPNQWDNLANVDGTAPSTTGVEALLADDTKEFFGQWVVDAADPVLAAVAGAFEAVGIDELQTLPADAAFGADGVPNLSWNESAPGLTSADAADELGLWNDTTDQFQVTYGGNPISTGTNIALSIVSTGGGVADAVYTDCATDAATDVSIRTPMAGATAIRTDSAHLNLINDAIDDDLCTLVVALGYGKDVPGTTIDSRVAIAQVPTVATADVNPKENYARAIALFQVAEDADNDGIIQADEVFPKARLIGVVDPEGRAIDTVINAANQG